MGKTTKLLVIALLFGALFLGVAGITADAPSFEDVSYGDFVFGDLVQVVAAQEGGGDPDNENGG